MAAAKRYFGLGKFGCCLPGGNLSCSTTKPHSRDLQASKRLDTCHCQEAELVLDVRGQQAHRMSGEATEPLSARAESCITRRMRKLLVKTGH